MSTEAVVVAVLPKVSGCLSILGSSFNLCDILTDRKKRKSTYPRLVAAMAMLDISTSFAYFLSTWPIPVQSGELWAMGNASTCTIQGFLLQLGFAIPMYNLCLTIYSGMVINLKWSKRRIKRYELGMHVTVLTLSLGIAIAGIPLKLYNDANLWCWIAAYPLDCHQGNADGGIVGVECVRGKYAWIYRWAFFYCPLWLIITLVTIGMVIIAYGAYRDERSTRNFRKRSVMSMSNSSSGGVNADNLSRLTSNVLWQCFYFVLAFYLTFTCPTVLRALQTVGRPVPFALKALMSSFLPLQGFLNAFVFLRPRFLRYRRNKPGECFCATMGKAVAKTLMKLRPSKRTRPVNLHRQRTYLEFSDTTTSTSVVNQQRNEGSQHQPVDVLVIGSSNAEVSDLSGYPVEIEKLASFRRRSSDEGEDGNSSDEEDGQQIVPMRDALHRDKNGKDEKPFCTVDDDSPEDNCHFVATAIAAVIDEIRKSGLTTSSSFEPGSPQDDSLLFEQGKEHSNETPTTRHQGNRLSVKSKDRELEQEQLTEKRNVKKDDKLKSGAVGSLGDVAALTVPRSQGPQSPRDHVQNMAMHTQRGTMGNGSSSFALSSDDEVEEEGAELSLSKRLARRFPAPHFPNDDSKALGL